MNPTEAAVGEDGDDVAGACVFLDLGDDGFEIG
jgi:hypothetical protein